MTEPNQNKTEHNRNYGALRFRNSLYRCIYIIGLKWKSTITLGINILILGISIGFFINDLTTVSSFLLGFTIISLIWSIIQMRTEVRNFGQTRKCNIVEMIVPYDKIEPGPKENTNGYIPVRIDKEQECAFYSKEINENLRRNNPKIEISDKKYKKVRKVFKEHLNNQISFLTKMVTDSNQRKKLFANYPKLCVSSDLTIKNTGENGKITCHRGGYYDTQLSNIISWKKLFSEDNKELADGSIFSSFYQSYFVNEEGKNEWKYITKDMEDSVNNNEIGISTLGFSSDNKFIIWRQKENTQVSPNKLVPSGSGSCDYSDLKKNSLNETIKYAMVREILEESLLKGQDPPEGDNNIKNTMILGYFRWIKRGGKPEFVGLTKLAKERGSYAANGEEVVEAPDLQNERLCINSIHEIPEFVNYVKNLGQISVPLYMIAVFLENYYNSDKQKELEKFLNLKSK